MESHTSKRWWVFVGAFALSLAALRPALAQETKQPGNKFQPINVKPGLWESTTTYKTGGELPIPQAAMEKMTPEQRARLEANMNANSAAQTISDKHCVTQQELQNPLDQKHCTWTIVESTGTRGKGNVSCEEQGVTMTGTGEFEAVDQEHMIGSAHLATAAGGHTMTTDATFTSKWLGANCGSVK